MWWQILLSIRVQSKLNNRWFVFFLTTMSTSNKNILSVRDHRVTRWREQRYLYSYRQRQIGRSDCDIIANCGKIVLINSFCNHSMLQNISLSQLNCVETSELFRAVPMGSDDSRWFPMSFEASRWTPLSSDELQSRFIARMFLYLYQIEL